MVRNNHIHDGKQHGIFIHTQGAGTFDDNGIVGNAFAGALVKTGGKPALLRNVMSGNRRHGVEVEEDGGGRVEGNDLRGNSSGPFREAKPGSALFSKNTVA